MTREFLGLAAYLVLGVAGCFPALAVWLTPKVICRPCPWQEPQREEEGA